MSSSSYKPSLSTGVYGSYSLSKIPGGVSYKYDEDDLKSPHLSSEKYHENNIDLDADLALDLTHLAEVEELFNVNFNEAWNVFVANTISGYLVECKTKFDYYINTVAVGTKLSYCYNGKLSTKLKKGDVIIVTLNQEIVDFAPIPPKPSLANIDAIAPPIVHLVNLSGGDDEKVDMNKYKAATNGAVVSKLLSVKNSGMKLSKLKSVTPEAANNNELNYKLTLNLDYRREFKNPQQFSNEIKSEFASTLNIDVRSVCINSITAGSIIVRITVDEKGTTKLVQDYVLKQNEFEYWSINRCTKGKNMDYYYKNNDKCFNESTAMWRLLKSKYTGYQYQQMKQSAISKFNQMKASHSALIGPLSFDQIAAIYLYTTNYIYKDLREELTVMTSMKSTYADYVVELIVGINKLPMVWTKTFRGFSSWFNSQPGYFKQWQKNNILRWDGMNSTSREKTFARNWAASGFAAEIEGYHGRDIAPFSAYSNEKEVIHIISSHFLVTDQYSEGGKTWFKVKEMAFPWNDKAILWVDDKPQNNKTLMERLEREGTMIIPRVSTKQAMEFLKFMERLFMDSKQFNKYRIVSDMTRYERKNEDDPNSEIIKDTKAGATLVSQLRKRGYNHDVCIFTSDAQHAIDACKELGCSENIIATTSTEECYNFCNMQGPSDDAHAIAGHSMAILLGCSVETGAFLGALIGGH